MENIKGVTTEGQTAKRVLALQSRKKMGKLVADDHIRNSSDWNLRFSQH